ncbi:hypothetical protein [Actinoplanes sp. CA-252034]|uniref:hypothetical protein n=1 Tax=Actinoplanes sp. CA-252034 TaxID=3239906 RepID=UPI003D97F520
MSTAEEPERAEEAYEGDFRIRGDGKVEVFDGVAWRLYRLLPSADPGPIVREAIPPEHR